MTHVILAGCCNDATCVVACPVNAIHPTPNEPDYLTSEMLYIDPVSCIDCGACLAVCPVSAITPDTALTPDTQPFAELNAAYYQDRPESRRLTLKPAASPASAETNGRTLRVAIVGSGPAAMYCADELLRGGSDDVIVNVFDRLSIPWGLARFGVAPDHMETRRITELFEQIASRPQVHLFLGVEVGSDVEVEELAQHHDAIIFATGAQGSRRIGIPGEGLPGSHTASDFVAWYNGRPDLADAHLELGHGRAIVIGNGNVGLDIARILLSDPDELARTEIADAALEQLTSSSISEVVVLGRRGPAEAAYTASQMMLTAGNTTFDVLTDRNDLHGFQPEHDCCHPRNFIAAKKVALARETADRLPSRSRRLTLRFGWLPIEVVGGARAKGLRLSRTPSRTDDRMTATETELIIEYGLILSSVGRWGEPIRGAVFDSSVGRIPHLDGRVIDQKAGAPIPGQYVVGWIKRGPGGFVGTNRRDAEETVESVRQDWRAGTLGSNVSDQDALESLLVARVPHLVDTEGWRRIDITERARARAGQVKRPIADRAALVGIGRRD